MGSVENFAPVKIHKFHTKQILIKHLPHQCNQEEVNHLVSQYGSVEKFDLLSQEKECSVSITYESPDQAQRARDGLNGENFHGAILKVDYVTENGKPHGRSKSESRASNKSQRSVALPLRILVPSQYIGAIIGKKGESIKSITTKCKARVDVHGKENNGLLEKIISIYGQPENCSNACKEILQVINNEAKNGTKTEVLLKMLTNDRYCGRIIGKEGRMIKKIREDTSTKIVVNSAHDMLSLYPDRVISIRGNIDNMVQAELAIAGKLAQCIEQDSKYPSYVAPQFMAGSYQYGIAPPTAAAADPKYYSLNGGAHMTRSCPASVGGPTPAAVYPQVRQQQQPVSELEVCQVQVPNAAVGAIIGAAGANIKQMMRSSGAFITVESRKDAELTPSSERIVTIRGTPDANWRGNYYVFEKMKAEGFSGLDEVRLMTMIKIPRAAVGRVIGKSGRNVRDIQANTGTIIKLPLDNKPTATTVEPETTANQQLTAAGGASEVVVEVHGTFVATMVAQRRIRALVDLALNGPTTNGGVGALNGPTTNGGVGSSNGELGGYNPYLQPRQSRSAPKVIAA